MKSSMKTCRFGSRYRTADPKAEFVALVTGRLESLAGPDDVLNRCARPPCYRKAASAAERRADAALQTLTSKQASLESMQFVDFMPDVGFLRIPTGQPLAGSGVYPDTQQGAYERGLHVR